MSDATNRLAAQIEREIRQLSDERNTGFVTAAEYRRRRHELEQRRERLFLGIPRVRDA